MCQTDEVDMIERKAVNLLDRVSVDGERIRTKGPPPPPFNALPLHSPV